MTPEQTQKLEATLRQLMECRKLLEAALSDNVVAP